MSNFRKMTPPMAPEWVSEKIQTLKYEHIIDHFNVIWRFR